MIQRNSAWLAASLAALTLPLVGCGSNTPKTTPAPTPVLRDAASQLADLENSVKATPKDPEAWHKLAQAYSQAEDYPKAIGAAQTGLELDPDNQELRGLQAAASMRLAQQNVRVMRDQHPTGDSLTDAKILADQLRQSLGVTQIVSPEPPPEPKSAVHPKRAHLFGKGRRLTPAHPKVPASQPVHHRPASANNAAGHARLVKHGTRRVIVHRPVVAPAVPPRVHTPPSRPVVRSAPVMTKTPVITNQPVRSVSSHPASAPSAAPRNPFAQLQH